MKNMQRYIVREVRRQTGKKGRLTGAKKKEERKSKTRATRYKKL